MDFQGGLIVLIIFVSLFAIWLIFYFIPVGLWFSALVSGVRISLLQLILMCWRKVPPSTIVSSMIESTKAGLSLDPNELEAHYLAGGNVTSVVHARPRKPTLCSTSRWPRPSTSRAATCSRPCRCR